MTGAETLGMNPFSYDTYEDRLTPDLLHAAHQRLLSDGFLFAGWHGTQRAVCELLINGDPIRQSEPGGDDIWNGLYVSNKVEQAFGYTGGHDFPPSAGGLLRTYVRDADIDHIVVASGDINHILSSDDTMGSIRTGRRRYALSGPESLSSVEDGTDQQAHEMVLSTALLNSIVFLPSLHTVRVERKELHLSASTHERQFAGYDLTQRGHGFNLN